VKYQSSGTYSSQEEDFLIFAKFPSFFAPCGTPWLTCPFILTNLNPQLPMTLTANLVEFGQFGFREEVENVEKSTHNTRQTTDKY